MIQDRTGFQGKIGRAPYFEGWYLKHVTTDRSTSVAFIPGVALDGLDDHAFIQILDGKSGDTRYIRYPIEEFEASRDSFSVRIAENRFSSDACHISIEDQGCRISGDLTYQGRVPYPSSWVSPNIMGPFSHIPWMQCNHGVVAADMSVDGVLRFGDEQRSFEGSPGYIEKDWGSSFPSSWIWYHCNSFSEADLSCMFSFARIPVAATHFWGFLAFLVHRGEWYRFSTYSGSRVSIDQLGEGTFTVRLKNRHHQLMITAGASCSGTLKAPVKGSMERDIFESLSAKTEIRLEDSRGRVLLASEGSCAGLEVCGAQQLHEAAAVKDSRT